MLRSIMHRIISVLSKNGKIEEESFLERFVRSSKVSRISCCASVFEKDILPPCKLLSICII